MKLIRPQHFDVVSEDIVRQWLKISFWLSWLIPFGVMKVAELIKVYFEI